MRIGKCSPTTSRNTDTGEKGGSGDLKAAIQLVNGGAFWENQNIARLTLK